MIVVKSFKDLQDGNHIYHMGDIFPRVGVKATNERVKYLMGANPKGKVYIRDEVKHENVEPKLENDETPKITKSKIFTMRASDLRSLASENGLENAEDYTGNELKKWLIEKLGL